MVSFIVKASLITLLLISATTAEEEQNEEFQTYEEANKKVNCMMPISMAEVESHEWYNDYLYNVVLSEALGGCQEFFVLKTYMEHPFEANEEGTGLKRVNTYFFPTYGEYDSSYLIDIDSFRRSEIRRGNYFGHLNEDGQSYSEGYIGSVILLFEDK